MEDQTESFDPYQQWLEIQVEDQPPNHYRLLGVTDFESNPDLIDEAAKARAAYLHRIAAGPERKAVQRLLTEVASARRTLLNAEAKAAYDGQLLAEGEPDDRSIAPTIQLAATDSGVRRGASGKSRAEAASVTASRRKKSALNAWGLHAISASVLLVITIIVLIVNSGKVERLASQPAAAPYHPSASATSSSLQGQQQNRSLALDLSRSNSTGSTSLASDLSAAKNAKSAKPTPKKSTAPKSTVKLTLKGDWLEGLTLVEDFSNSLKGRFNKTESDGRIALADGRLVIKQSDADKKHFAMQSTKLVLIPGQSVAIETNLTKGLPDQMRVGLGLGTLRIFIVSKPKNLEIKALQTNLGTFNPGDKQNLTLILIRDALQNDVVNWVLRAGDKSIDGRIRFGEPLAVDVPVLLLATCPQTATNKPIWIDNLRHGTQNQPPELRNPKEVKVNVSPPKK